MSFEKIIRIPDDRIGVLIGKSGKVKSEIEKTCFVKINIDGESGEIMINTDTDSYTHYLQNDANNHNANDDHNLINFHPFKAVEIITAIGRGFSPQKAMTLLEGENTLHVIDLREFVGKSSSQIERIKGRIIGEGGKARKSMENLSGTHISVYGRTVAIIGDTNKLRTAVDAIVSLSNGKMHNTVYSKLEAIRRKEKIERLQLWEDQNVF
jgi:ribosomal RNA assembly protein